MSSSASTDYAVVVDAVAQPGLAPARTTRRLGAALPFLGPALIASVAYMDPGNVATNIQGGALAGYNLLWVVLLANVVAMLFQALGEARHRDRKKPGRA